MDSVLASTEILRQQLNHLIAERRSSAATPSTFDPGIWGKLELFAPADIFVTANEVSERHGTGVLIQRIFGGAPNAISIRSRNTYDGSQKFGDLKFCLPCENLSRVEIFSIVLRMLEGIRAQRAVCVPYYREEVLVAIALKELFAVPLCTYIMDDQNLSSDGIPDSLMRELLEKSDFRLAISPEMRNAYQDKYRFKFYLLPPVLSKDLILTSPAEPSSQATEQSGIIIGNIWGQHWFNLLRRMIKNSGVQMHWYCNGSPRWLNYDEEELRQEGIILHGALPEFELAQVLRSFVFVLVPSGTLDEHDDNKAVARFSLPTRVPFIVASSNTPIIVAGHGDVASAKFVKRFGLGTVCHYESGSFQRAIAELSAPRRQQECRNNACSIAEVFSAEGIAEWIWKSLEKGEAFDDRFERLMPPNSREFAYYVEPPIPKDIDHDFVPIYRAMRKLLHLGYKPDFILDLGASTGIWSRVASNFFPTARFLLVDPIASRYQKKLEQPVRPETRFERVEKAISDTPGKAVLTIASDLYNSSFFEVAEAGASGERKEVEVTTLDQLAEELAISGKGLVKIDVQSAEHLVITGGHSFLLKHTDLVVMELSLSRLAATTKTFLEMINVLDELKFRYWEDVGEWRSAIDGTLQQKDVLFVREGLF